MRTHARRSSSVSHCGLEATLTVDGVPEDLIQPYVQAGLLQPVLEDWWPRQAGYYLYYPSRRQQSPALALVIEALRLRA